MLNPRYIIGARTGIQLDGEKQRVAVLVQFLGEDQKPTDGFMMTSDRARLVAKQLIEKADMIDDPKKFAEYVKTMESDNAEKHSS